MDDGRGGSRTYGMMDDISCSMIAALTVLRRLSPASLSFTAGAITNAIPQLSGVRFSRGSRSSFDRKRAIEACVLALARMAGLSLTGIFSG